LRTHYRVRGQCNVQGTTPPYFELRGRRLASGAPFTQTDVDAGANVVVLGPTTADRLFGAADPVGEMIRMRKVPFTVAGVLAPVGADDDDVAVVPLTTFLAKIHYGLGRTFDGAFLVRGSCPNERRSTWQQMLS
jgi:putative ABC transport system permease protein